MGRSLVWILPHQHSISHRQHDRLADLVYSMTWLWLILPAGFLIAGGALWFAASKPEFWIRTIRIVVNALLPKLLKRKSPEQEAEDRARASRGELSARRRPGTGGKHG